MVAEGSEWLENKIDESLGKLGKNQTWKLEINMTIR